MSARTLKIRSEQNGTYSKKYLTRMRFVLPQDLMLTDAGNSYLSLQTNLMDSNNNPINTKLHPTGKRTYYGLGNGTTAYSPSCMIRTAKLFSQLSNKVIEEINYSNVKTANFESLQSDIDTFGSSTSFNGSALSEEIITNIQDNWSQWSKGGSQELQIRLKDLFPSLNTAVYSLQQSPLIIDLEMEVNRDLVNVMFQNALIQEPPSVTAGGGTGFVSTGLTAPATCLVQAQVNKAFQNIQTPNLVEAPMVWIYEAFDYDAETIYSERDANGDVLPTGNYVFKTKWLASDFAPLGFLDQNQILVQANQVIRNTNGEVQQEFTIVDTLNTTTAAPDDAVFGMATQFQAVRDTYNDNKSIELSSLNPFVMAASDYLISDPRDAADAQVMFESLRDTKSFVLSAREITGFAALGLLDNNNHPTPNKSFRAYLKLGDNPALTTVATDIEWFIDPNTFWVSNQSIALPRTAPGRMSIESFNTTTNVMTFTQDLMLNGDGTDAYSLPLGFFSINTSGDVVPSVSTVLTIVNVLDETAANPPGLILAGAYPQVSKAEIVLKQYPGSSIQKMPSLYRTFKCEPFNISTGFSELVQNFEIEGNVYNAYVVLPPPTVDSNLISYGRNVEEWRATIDDIDLTNVNVKTGGDYPSTLYYDRLVDTFANSQMALRCLDGRVVGAKAGKTRIIPIKIYQSMVNGQAVLSPSMKRLQVRMLAKRGELIVPGTAYLFKELYMSY